MAAGADLMLKGAYTQEPHPPDDLRRRATRHIIMGSPIPVLMAR